MIVVTANTVVDRVLAGARAPALQQTKLTDQLRVIRHRDLAAQEQRQAVEIEIGPNPRAPEILNAGREERAGHPAFAVVVTPNRPATIIPRELGKLRRRRVEIMTA